MHPLDMDDPAIWLQLQVFAGQIKAPAGGVRPLEADFSAGPRLADADRLGRALRTKQPFSGFFRRAAPRRCRPAWSSPPDQAAISGSASAPHGRDRLLQASRRSA